MRDYRVRYQSIKDKGKELGITLAQYMNKEKFLYFTNNYYANFSTIPLEDYLSIKVYDAETSGERLYPLISLAIERITTLEDSSPYKELGYRIISKYEEEDTNKEKKHPIFYLPIELSLLFNPYNEATIEETLARYLLTLFKPKHTTKEQLIELVKKDFNKYALLFDAYFSGGYLISDTPLEFEDLIGLTINKKQYQKRHIIQDAEDQKAQIISVINNEDIFSARGGSPFNSNPEDKEPLFSNDAKEFITNLVNNIPSDTPSFNIFKPYINFFNSGNINFIYLTLSFLVSSKNTLGEIDKQIEDISTFKDKETYLIYKKAYEMLFKGNKAPRVSPSTIYKETTPIEETRKIPVSNNLIDITKSLQLNIKKVSEDNYLDALKKYNAMEQYISQLENDRGEIDIKLMKEGQDNGYNTPYYRQLMKEKEEIILTLDNAKQELGKTGENGNPYNYFMVGKDHFNLTNPLTRSIQISPTESITILNERTKLYCSNNTLLELTNERIRPVLLFLISLSVKQLSNEIIISNEEIEQEILGERYKDASLKDRNNARNTYFYPVLNTLQRTSIIYTNNKKEFVFGKRQQGSIIYDFDILSNPNKIILNKRFFEEAIQLKNDAPISKNIYKLSPRAKSTAYYFHIIYFLNNSDSGKEEDKKEVLSFESLSKLAQYSINLKYLDRTPTSSPKPERFYLPILEDLEEMRQVGILKNYTPTKKQYLDKKTPLKNRDSLSYMISLYFVEKPLKRRDKRK